jgi:hypothetical protein
VAEGGKAPHRLDRRPRQAGGRSHRDDGGSISTPLPVSDSSIERARRDFGTVQPRLMIDEPTRDAIMKGSTSDLSAPQRAAGGRLTAGERQHMPKSGFALPGKGEGPKGAGSGSYPIPDAGHAKSALARAKHNASPAEQATIRRKVHAKFPGMQLSED